MRLRMPRRCAPHCVCQSARTKAVRSQAAKALDDMEALPKDRRVRENVNYKAPGVVCRFGRVCGLVVASRPTPKHLQRLKPALKHPIFLSVSTLGGISLCYRFLSCIVFSSLQGIKIEMRHSL